MPMTYEEALAFIHGAYGQGKKQGLANMHALLARLGDPHKRLQALHVAGTNGKGSVCAFLQAALRAAGYRTGLYTSPFLQRYNERMRVDGLPIPDARLAALTDRVAMAVEALRAEGIRPTEFEIGTGIAFLYFAEEAVDFAVIEVGLGGLHDPTNVLLPRVTGIASIGLDHRHVLGDTEEVIAAQKAGIAKKNVPLLLSAQASPAVRAVVGDCCARAGAGFAIAPPTDAPLGLVGDYQRYNAGLALGMLHALRTQGVNLPEEKLLEGLRRARWPGRLEWLPGEAIPLLLDGAHNPQGAASLAAYLSTLPNRKTVLLCGVMGDKDWAGIVAALAGAVNSVITVAPDSHRALNPQSLAEEFNSHGTPARAAASLPEGLLEAQQLAGTEGRVVAAGSLYLVGALRTLVCGENDTLLGEA
ncbi:MAG: bifunctional folylpolyglutamate synthase/dihydrofolate synthase [Oscillospiraceae bacterium]|nr:bifunctional folylpolyglutamate synthase/dihydrofolate synthase [Oscillospiraceae bacterium]